MTVTVIISFILEHSVALYFFYFCLLFVLCFCFCLCLVILMYLFLHLCYITPYLSIVVLYCQTIICMIDICLSRYTIRSYYLTSLCFAPLLCFLLCFFALLSALLCCFVFLFPPQTLEFFITCHFLSAAKPQKFFLVVNPYI